MAALMEKGWECIPPTYHMHMTGKFLAQVERVPVAQSTIKDGSSTLRKQGTQEQVDLGKAVEEKETHGHTQICRT